MRYQVDVKPDKEKEFLQLMQVFQNLQVVKYFNKVDQNHKDEDRKSASREEMKGDVSSREMANQYRDLVD